MSGDVSRLIALLLIGALVTYIWKRRSAAGHRTEPRRRSADTSPRRWSGIGDFFSGTTKARRGPDYVELAVQKIIDSSEPAGNQWLVVGTCVLIAAKSEQHRRGLNNKMSTISAQIAAGVRKYMTEERARSHIQPMPLDDNSFTVHAITHPDGIVKVVAVQGPNPELDDEWKSLVEECRTTPAAHAGTRRPHNHHAPQFAGNEFTTIPATHASTGGSGGGGIPPTNAGGTTTAGAVVEAYLRGRKIASIPIDRNRRTVLVGRAAEAAVRIPAHETSVSGLHLRFDLDTADTLTVTDTSSSGTHLINPAGTQTTMSTGVTVNIATGTRLLLGPDNIVDVHIR